MEEFLFLRQLWLLNSTIYLVVSIFVPMTAERWYR
jgi:hypothetical protein